MTPSPVPSAPTRGDATALIDAAISRAGRLATLPEVALEVMRLAEDRSATSDDLDRVLSADPTLSALVLKIVNSAFYGVRREITAIGSAIAVLGFTAIKSIAVAASLSRMFRVGKLAGGFEARDLWTHSIAVATAARLVAARVPGVDPSSAFLAGLLHDIGIIVELQAFRSEFIAVVAAAQAAPEQSFRGIEQQLIGADHEAFGAALCRAWRFPDELQRVSGYHHRPMALPVESRRLTAIVHVADFFAAQARVGYARTVDVADFDPAVLEWLGLSDTDVSELRAALPALVEESLPLFHGGA